MRRLVAGVVVFGRHRCLPSSTGCCRDLLGLPAPRYRHHRLVLDANGAKLSKSRQSLSLAELRKRGVSSGEVRAALGFGAAGSGSDAVAFS